MHRVFVYGTLKRGLINHQLIASSHFLGPAATTERFRMIATASRSCSATLTDCRSLASFTRSIQRPASGWIILSASARAAVAVMSDLPLMCTIWTAKGLLQAWLSFTSSIPAAGKRCTGRNGTSPTASDNSNGRGRRHEVSGNCAALTLTDASQLSPTFMALFEVDLSASITVA